MRNILTAGLIAMAITFAGCSSMSNEEQYGFGGALAGGTLGALAGNAIGGRGATVLGAGAGAIFGAMAGSEIGARMDAADLARTQRIIDKVPTGQTVAWNNPDTNSQYAVTPTKTYVNGSAGSETFCREVTISGGKIGGNVENVYGTACRQPDGSWKMQ